MPSRKRGSRSLTSKTETIPNLTMERYFTKINFVDSPTKLLQKDMFTRKHKHLSLKYLLAIICLSPHLPCLFRVVS